MRSVERKMGYDGKKWVDSRLALSLIKLNFFFFQFFCSIFRKTEVESSRMRKQGAKLSSALWELQPYFLNTRSRNVAFLRTMMLLFKEKTVKNVVPLYHCKPVASIVIRVSGIVYVVSSIVSLFNHRPCLERLHGLSPCWSCVGLAEQVAKQNEQARNVTLKYYQ